MSDGTHIEWTDATWNPVTGCSIASPGCKHCYAMLLAGTRLAGHPSRAGLTREVNGNHVWTGEVRFNQKWLDQPLRWRRPRRIFVCAHGDLFHEDVPDEWIDEVFAIMACTPQHQFQLLTKRSRRMREYLSGPWQTRVIPFLRKWQKRPAGHGVMLETVQGSLRNVWCGVSAENQHWLMQRACDLVETPAAVRFLSIEPLLDGMDIEPFVLPPRRWSNGWANNYPFAYPQHQIDWVIVGGESGPRARPMHPDWVRKLRDQCAAGGTAFLLKQWGEWLPWEPDHLPYFKAQDGQLIDRHALPDFDDAKLKGWTDKLFYEGDDICVHQLVGKKGAGRLLDGRTHDGFPEERV